jgi:tetrathionate reductase subunit A
MRPASQVIAGGNILKPDVNNAEFILYLGAYPGNSGKPMMAIARQTAVASHDGHLKFVVVDPVMAGGSVSPIGKTTRWVPIKPATDGALGAAMIRWMIENKRFSAAFLSSANLEAARKKGFGSWTNAAHLIIIDPKHPNARRLLRPKDLGLEVPAEPKSVDYFVAIDKATGVPCLHTQTGEGDLFYKGEVKGKNGSPIQVETAFSILKGSVFREDMATYAQACGIPEATIIDIANEFTSHGTKVAADGMGSTAVANGMDPSAALFALNAMVGSMNKKGGLIMRRMGFRSFASGPRYDLVDYPGKPKKEGVRIDRQSSNEKTSEYKNKIARGENPYPSKMPWHPVGEPVDNQALFSIVNGYPYPAKILMTWMANPLFSTPAGGRKEVIEELKKPARVPLFVAFDAFMGEMTSLADYVIPDFTGYEGWGLPSMEGNFAGKVTGLRWPVIKPMTAKLEDGRFACFENFVIDAAKMVGVPGFGNQAIPDMDKKIQALNNPEDYFLRALANAAYDGKAVPDISSEELNLQDLGNMTAPWLGSLKREEWPKVAYLIARGGRFEPYGDGFVGEDHKYALSRCFHIYIEPMAIARNSFTGQFYPGVMGWNPEAFADGTSVSKAFPPEQWPFKGVSYKAKLRSVSMMVNSSILLSMSPHNFIEINPEDAAKLDMKDGDKARLVSATGGEAVGILRVRQGIARGVVAVAFGYGHWEYGSRGHRFGEKKVGGDPRRAQGVLLSGISLVDPTVKGIFGHSEMPTGGPGRNGGAFRLEKV